MKRYLYGTIIGLTAFILVGGTIAAAKGYGMGFGSMGGSEDAAALLGMTTDQLQTALDDQTLPELLDAQGITHEQLQDFREEQRLDERATVLGITADELRTALENKTYAQLLDEAGISHTALQEQRQAQHLSQATEHLQSLVDDGSITQEQMDARLERMESHIGQGFGHGPRFDRP